VTWIPHRFIRAHDGSDRCQHVVAETQLSEYGCGGTEAQHVVFGEPRVVHCKREPFDVYIGRPSKWGNPYRIEGGRVSRSVAVEVYRKYVLREIAAGRLDPRELRGKVLGCWCAPKPCHGDVLFELANKKEE